MTRVLQIAGLLTGLSILGGGAFLLWASSSHLSQADLEREKTYPASPASADRDTFRAMTYNLSHLSGASGEASRPGSDSLFSTHMTEAIDLIQKADPDVIGLQDIDFGAARSGYVHQLDTIATRLDFLAAGQAVRWNERYLPFSGIHTGRIASGQALLSRFPIRRHVRRKLSHPQPSIWRQPFSSTPLVQVTAVDIGGWPLVVMNVHLDAPDATTREEQAREVNRLYDRLAQQGLPILLLGSTNSLMPAVAPGSSPGDDTMELLLEGTGLQPALSAEGTRIMGGSVATHPATNPTRKVDYIFYRPRLIVPIDAQIHCGDASPPSSHCAVSMSFFLPRPKDKLPDTRIPDDQLPSLDSLMSP